ncbi:hypothetical protein ACH5RR_037316 [Cinchona calisaya]|uniref:Uncharacterized protein n=1 Tax=Cinchona calisaya TaxID=153742 RepID=A0ABD2Y8W5_9GENT
MLVYKKIVENVKIFKFILDLYKSLMNSSGEFLVPSSSSTHEAFLEVRGEEQEETNDGNSAILEYFRNFSLSIDKDKFRHCCKMVDLSVSIVFFLDIS